MKPVFLLCLVCNIAIAQRKVDGFYVTNNNDTIAASFRPDWGLNKKVSEVYTSIKVADSGNSITVFKPGDIKVFWYNEKKFKRKFVSMPADGNQTMFLQLYREDSDTTYYYDGPEIKLYFYTKDYPSADQRIRWYYFTAEREDSKLLFFSDDDKKNERKKKFQDFFSDNKEILVVLDSYCNKSGLSIDRALAFIKKINSGT